MTKTTLEQKCCPISDACIKDKAPLMINVGIDHYCTVGIKDLKCPFLIQNLSLPYLGRRLYVCNYYNSGGKI